MSPKVQALFQEAIGHHGAGRMERARGMYEDILKLDPGCAAVMQNLGVMAGQLEDTEGAERWMRRSVEAEPGNGEYWSNLGTLYYKTGRTESAIEAYRESLRLRESAVT